MDTWEIVLLAIVGVLALLFLLGFAGNARVRRAGDRSLTAKIAAADNALAAARAEDRGWDPALLQTAARAAFEARKPGLAIETLHLIQVVDRPGTDEDRALMRVQHAAGAEDIELQRTGDRWDAS
jgi:type II secretory pathway pseudopilin PulG